MTQWLTFHEDDEEGDESQAGMFDKSRRNHFAPNRVFDTKHRNNLRPSRKNTDKHRKTPKNVETAEETPFT